MTTKNTPPAKTPSETESAPEQKPKKKRLLKRRRASARCWWWACSFLLFSRRTSSFPRGRWRTPCWSAITWWSTASRWLRRPSGCRWFTIASRSAATSWSSSSPANWTPDGKPTILFLVKRLIGVPGDHIHLRNGIVIVNGVAQSQPHAEPTTPENYRDYLDDFPSVPMTVDLAARPSAGPWICRITCRMATWSFRPASTS